MAASQFLECHGPVDLARVSWMFAFREDDERAAAGLGSRSSPIHFNFLASAAVFWSHGSLWHPGHEQQQHE